MFHQHVQLLELVFFFILSFPYFREISSRTINKFSFFIEDLYTYMAVNEPFEGIVQERPVFTNINNGIGLFSCRYNASHIMSFPSYTREGISIDLDSLHFIYP